MVACGGSEGRNDISDPESTELNQSGIVSGPDQVGMRPNPMSVTFARIQKEPNPGDFIPPYEPGASRWQRGPFVYGGKTIADYAVYTWVSLDGAGPDKPLSDAHLGERLYYSVKANDEATSYDVRAPGGKCTPIHGDGGTWRSSPVFPSAPAEVKRVFCHYEWAPDGGLGQAKPDLPSLMIMSRAVMIAASTIRGNGTGESTADETTRAVSEADGTSIEPFAGGCDVCAELVNDVVYAIFPPDGVGKRSTKVFADRVNGKMAAYALQPSLAQKYSSAVSAQLPRLDGIAYKDGAVAFHP